MSAIHVLLTCGTILRESQAADASAMPAIGDEVEIDDKRYTVANRVWLFPLDCKPSLNIVLVRRW